MSRQCGARLQRRHRARQNIESRVSQFKEEKSALFCRPSKKNATFVTRKPPRNCQEDYKPSRAVERR